ncbi:hypothetical protein ANANG_G00170630, partial [Anguilla anguilla]
MKCGASANRERERERRQMNERERGRESERASAMGNRWHIWLCAKATGMNCRTPVILRLVAGRW